jgi:aryl-alcohol dehydrogenase-like predicted oxidoreductase
MGVSDDAVRAGGCDAGDRTGGGGDEGPQAGQDGARVSVIGVGTWQLGGEWGRRFTQPEVDRLLGRARELAVNLVDTAECYGDARR